MYIIKNIIGVFTMKVFAWIKAETFFYKFYMNINYP